MVIGGYSKLMDYKEIQRTYSRTTAQITDVREYEVLDNEGNLSDERDVSLSYTVDGQAYETVIKKAKPIRIIKRLRRTNRQRRLVYVFLSILLCYAAYAKGFSVGYSMPFGWLKFRSSTGTPMYLNTSYRALPKCPNATAPW